MFKNPQSFFDSTYGKSIDTDNFPQSQKYQCWDLFDYFCREQGVNCSRYCALTGYAGDLYKLRYDYGYDDYFEFFYPKNAKRGDWYFSDRHVAMVWDVYTDGRVLLLGQNQGGKGYVNLKTYNLNDALGMMRWKGWIVKNGWIKENGNWYFYEKGEPVTGWHKLNWSKGQNWFYFMKDGVMVTGWQLITYKGKKEWFYFDSDGAMVTGFRECQAKGKVFWFLFNSDGVMQVGNIKMKLNFDSSGRMTGGEAI